MQCGRLDSLHLSGRSSPASAGEPWDGISSRAAAVQYVIWNISCCCPFDVTCPLALLYEQLFRALLGTASPIVLFSMVHERCWVAPARLRAAGLSQAPPIWGQGDLLLTGEFSLGLANSGFVKLFSVASHEKNTPVWIAEIWLSCSSGCAVGHGSSGGWVIKGRGWAWRWCHAEDPPLPPQPSLSSEECSSYLGCEVSREAGCTAASSIN